MGHTSGQTLRDNHNTVHPHIRGAYYLIAIFSLWLFGSSPHTWGIRNPSTTTDACCRFIPTYVGHTFRKCGRSQMLAVHPHIRGAYSVFMLGWVFIIGSSPHTWGILDSVTKEYDSTRFIPTYVGHTQVSHLLTAGFSVHPHIRGAY